MKPDIYEIITNKFIAQLEKGVVPWQRPWVAPQNLATHNAYRGINTFILANEERESPYWLSYRQASFLGGAVKKGEKGTPVLYWELLEKKDEHGQVIADENGNPKKIPFARWSNVFNLEQTENIRVPELSKEVRKSPSLEQAQEIIDNAFLPINTNSQLDAAFYVPITDCIEIPSIERFPNQQEFYHTLFHELTHATGHADRLNREGVTGEIKFGSERYAKEELIAELGASFLSNHTGILEECIFNNSSSYLNRWIGKLKENPKILIQAASAAQKASEFICNEAERKMEKHASREMEVENER